MSCESAMKRIKREVEDFYGEAVAAPAAASAAAAAAPIRGRSASRKPRVVTSAEKREKEEIIAQLKEADIPASAAEIARARSASRRAKLSPNSAGLNAERVKYEGQYNKVSKQIKDIIGKDTKIENAMKNPAIDKETKEKLQQLLKEKIEKHTLYHAAKKALEAKAKDKAKAAATSGGRRKSRSRRASRKQRKASRKSRRSRKSMRR